MKYIHELEAWSTPGKNLHPEYSKEVLQKEVWNNGVPKDFFLGISAIPDKTDCENLHASMQAGEFKEDEFIEFCVTNNLPPNFQSEEAAAKFLEYKNGRCLAWIHLPIAFEANLLSKITEILQSHGHIIVYPDRFLDEFISQTES